MLFEDEIWNIEMCAYETTVVYPTTSQNITFDSKTGEFREGAYFHLQSAYLDKDDHSKYIEIYGGDVDEFEVNAYRSLIEKISGEEAAKRVEMFKINFPIFAELVLYKLNLKQLKRNHPMLFLSVSDYIVGDELGFIIGPQHIPDLNFIIQDYYFDYAKNFIEHVLREAEPI